jgi:hypothetical protein
MCACCTVLPMYLVMGSSIVVAVGITLTMVRLFQDGYFYAAAGIMCCVGMLLLMFSLGVLFKKENQEFLEPVDVER